VNIHVGAENWKLEQQRDNTNIIETLKQILVGKGRRE
jgi:hypothetical protein